MSEFRFAYVFSDGCVLQRNKKICIFGTGETGKKVEVELNGSVVCTTVEDEKWKVFLPPMEASDGLILRAVSEETKIELKDVAIGEVWLAGGQSNMEFTISQDKNGADILKNDKPNVRFYYTPKYEYESAEFEHLSTESHWTYFNDPDGARANWSAVGYMFAKRISEALNVTVGIISCNWGGTSASCWVPKEDLLGAGPDVQTYWNDFYKNIEGKTFDEQLADYKEYLAFRAEWEPKCAKLYEERPDIEWDEVLSTIGHDRYPGPVNLCSPQRPCGLYGTMLKKVIGYTFAGVIFYQGESDDHKPYFYSELFEILIKRWRKDNGDDKLPFIAVQLPMHRFRTDPDFKNWPVIRLAQRKVVSKIQGCGLAVGIDCGQFNQIHPQDKKEVARRLALQALWLVYGKLSEKEANGPQVISIQYESNSAIVKCKNAEGGFDIKNGNANGFELAPLNTEFTDEDFVPARAEFSEDGTIVLTADAVDNPGAVRYLWTNWCEVNVYGKNGLPLEPFRG